MMRGALTNIVAFATMNGLPGTPIMSDITAPGLLRKPSAFSVSVTIDRAEEYFQGSPTAGTALRVDHQAAGAGVGLDLRPTTVLLFGNPSVATEVMQQEQRTGVDFPLSEYCCPASAVSVLDMGCVCTVLSDHGGLIAQWCWRARTLTATSASPGMTLRFSWAYVSWVGPVALRLRLRLRRCEGSWIG